MCWRSSQGRLEGRGLLRAFELGLKLLEQARRHYHCGEESLASSRVTVISVKWLLRLIRATTDDDHG